MIPRARVLIGVALAAISLTACGTTTNLGSGASLSSGLGLEGPTTSATGTALAGGTVSGSSPAAASNATSPAASQSGVDGVAESGSGTGVTLPSATAKPIVVGFTYAEDAAAGAAALGLSGTLGDQLAYAKIVVNDANAHGGLHGRKIDPVFFGYNPNPDAPSYPEQDQSACASFTQDHHVEVAIVNLSGDGLIQCLQKRNIPMVTEGYGAGESAQFFAQNPDLFMFDAINQDRRDEVWVNALHNEDYFLKWNAGSGGVGVAQVKIGVIAYDLPSYVEATTNSLLPALKSLGYANPDVTYVTAPESYANISSMESQLEAAVLKFKAHGDTHVIISDQNGVSTLFFMTSAQQQGYHPRYGVTTDNNMAVVATRVSASQLVGTLGIGWSPIGDLGTNEGNRYTSPGRKACDALMAKHGQSGKNYNEVFGLTACSTMTFLKTGYDSMSGALTSQLVASLQSLGSSYKPLLTPAAFIGPGRHDGLAAVRDYVYSTSCSCMAYSGGLIPLPH